MFSIWWLLLVFVVGVYTGAIAVAVLTMAARQEKSAAEATRNRLEHPGWRRRHAAVAQH